MEQIDISVITDMDKLKSLILDAREAIEIQQQNLQILNIRRQELLKEQEPKTKEAKKK